LQKILVRAIRAFPAENPPGKKESVLFRCCARVPALGSNGLPIDMDETLGLGQVKHREHGTSSASKFLYLEDINGEFFEFYFQVVPQTLIRGLIRYVAQYDVHLESCPSFSR
jgi:hypothetical protein